MQSLQQVMTLAQNTQHAFVFCDEERRIEWVNPAFEKLTGYSLSEIVGRHPHDFLHCEQTDAATVARMHDDLNAGRGTRAEVLNQARDGRRYWIDIDIQPVRRADGSVRGFISVELEVTDQVRSRQRLAAIFRNSACGLLIHDARGCVIDCNTYAHEVMGCTREQLLDPQQPWQQFAESGEPLPWDQRAVLRTLRTRTPIRNEVQGMALPGCELRWLLVSTELLDPADDDSGVVLSFTDITQRLAQTKELQRSHEAAASALTQLIAYRTALDQHSIVAVTDPQGRITFVNSGFCELSGYSADQLIGNNHHILSSGRNPKRYFADLWQTIQAGQTWTGEICNRARDGSFYWVETTIVPIVDENQLVPRTEGGKPEPKILQYVSISYDVTQRKQAERQLRESRERFKTLLAMSSDWYWEQDAEFRFTVISEGIETNGINRWTMIGKKRWETDVEEADDNWAAHQAVLQSHEPFRNFEYRIRDPRKEGQWLWFNVSGEPMFGSGGVFLGYRGFGRDITERRSEQEQMWQLANLDPLTNLPNRMKFNHALEQSVAEAQQSQQPFALAIIDLDNFKEVNDSLGHDAGDELLITVSRRLRSSLRSSDLIARLGGDEFGVIIQGIGSGQGLFRPLDAMMNAVATPMEIAGQPWRCTLSMGVTLFPADAWESGNLVKNADIALYRAKAGGRSQYVLFQPELKVAVERHASLLQDMEEAIKQQQLLLHYQPVVDLHSAKVIGMEALLRWQHTDLGLVTAGQFAQVFDNMDLAARLGLLVTRMAIEQAAIWKNSGVPFGKIAINVTAADFMLGNYPDYLTRLLQEQGLQPDDVCIEVTEGMFLGRTAGPVLEGIRALHDMGTEIAFDDFGTGYASLTHLRMPIDRLKIDRSFVQGIEHDETNAAIIRAVVELGLTLGKKVTVEGVETAEQVLTLRGIGCQQFQGYLFSRPLATCDVPGFIQALRISL